MDANEKQQAWALIGELHETKGGSKAQLYRVVEVLGIEMVQTLLAETRAIEATGGLLRKDGERRTIGGVFFSLVQNRCSKEQYKRIFKPPRPPQPVPVPAAPLSSTATSAAPVQPPPSAPAPSEQAHQIAGVIVEKLKISAKKQIAVARDVDRVGVPEALAALRATLTVEQQGGRTDAEGKRLKPLVIWRTALDAVNKQVTVVGGSDL
jgi:hypothetical protein